MEHSIGLEKKVVLLEKKVVFLEKNLVWILSGILTTIQSKHKGAQAEWEATANSIHQCGEPGAPLHLKLMAYHVDIARDEVPPPG